MKRLNRWFLFIFVIILITSIFFFCWYGVKSNHTDDIQEISFYIINDKNNGTFRTDIDFVIDFSKSIDFDENIGTLEDAQKCPFYIDFTFYTNVSFGFYQLEYTWKSFLDTRYMQVIGDGVEFSNTPGDYRLTWFKSKINEDHYDFRLYISDIIRHPTTEGYTLNIDMWIYNQNSSQLKNTFDISQTFWLKYFESKQIELINTNIDFYLLNNFEMVGTEFYQRSSHIVDEGSTILNVTRSDIDFSSKSSRRNSFISDIFFDLSITFPLSSIISYIILDSIVTIDNKEEKEAIKAIMNQNEELLKQIIEIKEHLGNNDTIMDE